MAGSRVEKYGSIFTRMRGLLQTGAIQEIDKPVWYDIYAARPPKVEPSLDRHFPVAKVHPILYKEDTIRAEFYKTYSISEVIDMRDHFSVPICQRFIQKYQELEQAGHKDNITALAASELVAEGFVLRTTEQIKQEAAERKEQWRAQAELRADKAKKDRVSIQDLFLEPENQGDRLDDFELDPPPEKS